MELITLYPLTFFEFLNSIGGMPEAVLSFVQNRNLERVREIQRAIVSGYSADFPKHISSADIPKVNMLWNSIPAQLAKEKKKFIYSDVKQGARAREYENALAWLVKSGLVYQVNRVSLPGLPLISYQEREHFKLYMLDIGLLAAKTNLDITTLLAPDTSLFHHFKGAWHPMDALSEQYVLQELKALDNTLPIFYRTNAKNTSEIDFIIQKWDSVIPLEVKAETNLKAKSLASFMEIHKPQKAIRASLADYKRHGNLYEVPLYLVGSLYGYVKK